MANKGRRPEKNRHEASPRQMRPDARAGLREVRVLAAQDRLHGGAEIGFRHQPFRWRDGGLFHRARRGRRCRILQHHVESFALKIQGIGHHGTVGRCGRKGTFQGQERLRCICAAAGQHPVFGKGGGDADRGERGGDHRDHARYASQRKYVQSPNLHYALGFYQIQPSAASADLWYNSGRTQRTKKGPREQQPWR